MISVGFVPAAMRRSATVRPAIPAPTITVRGLTRRRVNLSVLEEDGAIALVVRIAVRVCGESPYLGLPIKVTVEPCELMAGYDGRNCGSEDTDHG